MDIINANRIILRNTTWCHNQRECGVISESVSELIVLLCKMQDVIGINIPIF